MKYLLLAGAGLAVLFKASPARANDDYRVVGPVSEWNARAESGQIHYYSVAEAVHVGTNRRDILLSVGRPIPGNRLEWKRTIVAWNDFDVFFPQTYMPKVHTKGFIGDIRNWVSKLPARIREVAEDIGDVRRWVRELKDALLALLREASGFIRDIIGAVGEVADAATGSLAVKSVHDAGVNGEAQKWPLSRRVATAFSEITKANPKSATAYSRAILERAK